jgi:hypothetical protein
MNYLIITPVYEGGHRGDAELLGPFTEDELDGFNTRNREHLLHDTGWRYEVKTVTPTNIEEWEKEAADYQAEMVEA